jgi:fermentation-respiration switch protein FrsA (DUF1100 family)
MALLKWLLLSAGIGYLCLAALLYVRQRSLMYFPDPGRVSPAAAGLPQAEEVELATSDGERVIAWHIAPRGDQPIVLYFQGNGGNVAGRGERFRRLTSGGVGLLALSYRGYGGSSGSPSEAGLLRDGAAAYEFAAARYPASRIVLWGESLGTAVAVAIAATRPVAGLALESPFTSTVDLAASIYWFMPVRFLMKDTFHSDKRIGSVTAPILILHGTRDEVVPIELGKRLYETVRAPKRFLPLPGAGHNDHDAYGVVEAVRDFAMELMPANALGDERDMV